VGYGRINQIRLFLDGNYNYVKRGNDNDFNSLFNQANILELLPDFNTLKTNPNIKDFLDS
jgi:hypothetical protein